MSDADYEIPSENLPDGFAESIEEVPETPAIPRPAATVALARDGDNGLEVLVVQRTRSSGFVPGAWVFPGGRVDAADAEPALVDRTEGLTTDHAQARMELGGDRLFPGSGPRGVRGNGATRRRDGRWGPGPIERRQRAHGRSA